MTNQQPSPRGRTRPDRRSSSRFPLNQEVQYRLMDSLEASGAGATVDMSSRGVLFTADRAIEQGARVRLSVDWPVHLDDGCGLKLVAMGRVVRSEEQRIAMVIDKYEFRTRGSKLG
jgi:hypothetical protein